MDEDVECPGLRHADDLAGSWVCPCHVVMHVYGNTSLPPSAIVCEAVQLESARQYMWFYSRSSVSTISNLNSGVKHIRKFEDKFKVRLTPTPLRKENFSVVANAWYDERDGSQRSLRQKESSQLLVQTLVIESMSLLYKHVRIVTCVPQVHLWEVS
jgi:hypothetical protein